MPNPPELPTPDRLEQLAERLIAFGCPADKALVMARQLDRRARMDADRNGTTYDAALAHLLGLMAQGWAAKRSA